MVDAAPAPGGAVRASRGVLRRMATAGAVWSIACLLPSPAALAAGPEESQGSYTLGEVVVTGPAEGVQAAQAVSTVTAENIQERNARTLEQALSPLPGVNIRIGAEGVPRIDVRGFRTRHVLLLLDGIPLNSAFDQQFDPTIIPTENIAEIKLTRGSNSVLYGQGGLGGVTNIITKKGVEGVRATVGAEAGDREPYLARASVSGAESDLDFFLSGSSTKQADFRLSSGYVPTPEQGPDFRINSDRQRNDVFGNIGFAPTRDLTLGLTASFAEGYFGKPSSVIRDPFDPFATPPRYDRVDDFTNVSIQGAAAYQATRQLSVRGWAFVNHLDEQDNRYDDLTFTSTNLVAGSFRERSGSTIEGVSLQPKYDLESKGVVTALVAVEGDSWTNSGQLTIAPNTFSPVNESHSFNIYSAAVQYELSPVRGMGLAAGYGHFWQVGSERHDDGFSALGAIHYDILENTRLKASASRNIRFPTLRDLYDPSQGNPALAAELAYTYEGGVEQRLPRNALASVNAFYTVAKNLIQQDQATGRGTNLPDIRFAGFEIAAATGPGALLLRASYSYLHSEDLSREGREEQQYTPRDKLALEARYDFPFGFSPYVSFQYIANQYFYTKNNVTPVQKARLDDIFLADVKLSQRLAGNRLRLYLGASNVLDLNYETAYGFPQRGRFVYGGFELRI